MPPPRFTFSWAEEVHHFCSIHYLLETMLSLAYMLLHTLPPICSYLFESCTLNLREYELLVFLACVVAIKNRKQPTARHFLGNLFMFSKVLNAYLWFNENLSYGVVYSICLLIAFIFFPEQLYTGPNKVVQFRANALQDQLARDQSAPTDQYWFILFYAPWSPPCVSWSREFAQISEKYGDLSNLGFGKVEASRYANVAAAFSVDTGVMSRHLPTVICFKNGEAVFRRPAMDVKGRASLYTWTKENFICDFDLDRIYEEAGTSSLSETTVTDKKTQ